MTEMAEIQTSSLLGMDREELAALVSEAGEPGYRAKQIMDAVYRQRVESLEEISTLPSELRQKLAASGVTVGAARIEKKFVSVDGTVRYLIGFGDGQSVETVWMPEGDGGEAGDGSEAGEEAESAVTSPSGAKAQSEEAGQIAALKRCATQNRSTAKSNPDAKIKSKPKSKPEIGTGERALDKIGPVDDLHFQPGGVCGRLPVLSDGVAGGEAQSDGG